jgi:hypothetical protein
VFGGAGACHRCCQGIRLSGSTACVAAHSGRRPDCEPMSAAAPWRRRRLSGQGRVREDPGGQAGRQQQGRCGCRLQSVRAAFGWGRRAAYARVGLHTPTSHPTRCKRAKRGARKRGVEFSQTNAVQDKVHAAANALLARGCRAPRRLCEGLADGRARFISRAAKAMSGCFGTRHDGCLEGVLDGNAHAWRGPKNNLRVGWGGVLPAVAARFRHGKARASTACAANQGTGGGSREPSALGRAGPTWRRRRGAPASARGPRGPMT